MNTSEIAIEILPSRPSNFDEWPPCMQRRFLQQVAGKAVVLGINREVRIGRLFRFFEEEERNVV